VSEKRIFRFVHAQARRSAADLCLSAPDGYICTIQEPNRSLDQNAAQWPILQAFADQLEWPVNGQMVKLTDEEWKDVLTAAFRMDQPRIAQGLDGGMVLLGQRTSKFGKREFSDWLEFLHATAAARGVRIYPQERAA
jgi:hypothetical protein